MLKEVVAERASDEQDTRDLISDTKFYESYSRWNEEEQRYESWDEAVERVMNMHREFYKDKMTDELAVLIDEAEAAYKEKRVLGAQRALQFGGDQILKHMMRMYNCTSSYADRVAFFQEIFYILLCGAGAGFSVQRHHVEELPQIAERKKQAKVYKPDDSIEGWANCLGVLLSSYFVGGGTFPEYEGRRVFFDLSEIRPKGSMISGGFKAPGPEPLRKALDKIEYLLQGLILKGETVLRPIHVYDIVMFAADAVLAGGVRRSATICLFSPDDEEMIKAKTGNWIVDNPQRGRSNNSAVIVRDEVTFDQFKYFMNSIKEYGEPGFFFVEDKEFTTNPCVEIGMFPQIDGKSGWQGCVSYDTKLITKSGIEKIGEVVDQKRDIEIWNGKKWSKVTPIQTGENRKLYRVIFSDGSYLDCTENHNFLVKNRFETEYRELTTSELIANDEKYELHVPRANISHNDGVYEKNAYEYGYILGDGSCTMNGNSIRLPRAMVGEDYIDKISFSSDTIVNESSYEYNGKVKKYLDIAFPQVDRKFAYRLKYNSGLPKELFQWDRESIKAFVAGWIDADGTKKNNGFAIAGKEDDIRDLQLLLKKIGIEHVSVNLAISAGEKTNVGMRNQDLWYAHVCDAKDLWCKKFEMPRRTSEIRKGKNQIIKEIVPLPGLHNSYCFEELEEHCGVFNNVLTKQCNLTEINGGAAETPEEFYRACRAAAILGTLQAGYTDFKYIDETSKKIFDREALLGVSVTGWMSNPKILLDEKVQRKGAETVLKVNEEVAEMIGINPCARGTCVKPSGNASVLLQTTSGIHGEHAPRYLRTAQINKESEIAQLIAEKMPYMVEESIWSANGTDYSISFPVIADKDAIYKDQLNGKRLLEKVKSVQQNWVEYGTRKEACADERLRHNVSNTVTVTDLEWDEVTEYVFKNRAFFAGISFLGAHGDKDYPQAPFTTIMSEDDVLVKYGRASFFASGLIVDAANGFRDLWEATSAAKHEEEQIGESLDLRAQWIRRFKKFADNYFEGNMTQAEYCLKDVALLHKWTKIQQNMTDVDFTDQLTTKSYIDIDTMGSIACSGQACEVSF